MSNQPPAMTLCSRWSTPALSRQSRDSTPASFMQSRDSTPGDEQTPPISREYMPVQSLCDVQQPSTPSSDSTIRTGTAARSATTIQEILDAQQDTQTVHDKGKQRVIESNSDSQGGFHVQCLDLPPWPPVSQDPVLSLQLITVVKNMQAWPRFLVPSPATPHASLCLLLVAPRPSTPLWTQPASTSCDIRASAPAPITDPTDSGPDTSSDAPPAQPNVFPSNGPSPQAQPGNGSTVNEMLPPLLSYFSSGMDILLNSIQKLQTMSHETVMKEIGIMREQLRTSNLASKNQQGAGTRESDDSFPWLRRKKASKQHHFVAANPELLVTSQDEQEHSTFLRCIHVHTLTLLKIQGYKYLQNAQCSPSQLQVDEYEQGLPGCLEITLTNFMPPCLPKTSSTRLQDTLAFLAHLTYVKARYREVVTAVDEDPEKARQAKNTHLQKSSRGSRKVCLLKMHLDAMANHPTLGQHLPLIKDLGTQAMSSDESEDKVRRTISYPHVYPAWCSDLLATLLWQADDVAAATATVPIGTWKKANAVQFSAEGRIFLLAFHDSAMFWCFKYMVHCHDYVDRNRHHTPELNAKILLDAFLDFKIPAEVLLGVRGAVQGVELMCLSSHGLPKYHDKAVLTSAHQGGVTAREYTPPQSPASEGSNSHEDANGRLNLPQSRSTAVDDSTGGTGKHIPRPIDPDIHPVINTLLATFNSLHTLQSQSIAMGDNAGGTSEPNPDLIILEDQPAADALLSLSATDQGASQLTVIGQRCSLLLAPINLGEGSPDCDVIGHQKKRKLI
ncbi:hypothetical protein EDC04DRAFT_2908314 [Pisolithus marmoratus]|nr:hypothetical protein EDC04DRAFT_2908314 [Pisolithus marmoratus]